MENQNSTVVFVSLLSAIFVSGVVSWSVVQSYKPTFAQCGSLGRTVTVDRSQVVASTKSAVPEQNPKMFSGNLLDGKAETLAYPENLNLDYLIELNELYPFQSISIVWGGYGLQPNYVKHWVMDGCNRDGQWIRLGKGGFPASEVSRVEIKKVVSQVRIEAQSAKDWIGIYEVIFE